MQQQPRYTEVETPSSLYDPAPGTPHSTAQHATATSPSAARAATQAATEEAAKDSENTEPKAWYKEGAMIRKVVIVVIVIAVGYLGWLGFQKWKTNRDYTSGDIYADDFKPTPTRSGESAGTSIQSRNSANSSGNGGYAIPASDSQSANNPNGQIFSGTGKFQVYRQGNLTWRVNTETGETCILFATEDEWRKPIVYNHGCPA